MDENSFIEEVAKLGIDLQEEQLGTLDKFYKLLIKWNDKINLTGITDREEVYLKHFYDSLTLVKALDLTEEISLCDVGTGAGFPGIVLKIIFPNLRIVLIDSLNKRVNYLKEVIKELGLENIKCYHMRMEDYAKLNEEKFDVITARAVSNIRVLAEISAKSLKIGGKLVLMKGLVDEELVDIDSCFKKLNLKLSNVLKFTLPKENSNRSLVVIEKIGKTPVNFPRPIDKIKKKPL